MTLVKCAVCGHSISDMALSCPTCGHPNELVHTTKESERVAAQSNLTVGTKRLITHKYTIRALMVLLAAWIVGCISTKTDPTKLYLIFSYPIGILGIAAQGLGSLTVAFAIVGLIIFVYGKAKKTYPSFYSYLAWTTFVSALLSLK
jgi:hypothetical protein